MIDRRAPDLRSPLVGRDVEVGRGQQALDLLAGGHGSVMLVAGEPGIGKTRLT